MNLPYLHLLLNHVPIVATFFGICVLIYGLISKQLLLQKTAFVFFIFAALITIPVMHTGEKAEEVVEEMASVSHDLVEEHEEAAEVASIASRILGLLALIALLLPYFKQPLKPWLSVLILLGGVVAMVLFGKAGLEGGKIIHTEMHGSIPSGTQNETHDESHE